MNSKALTAVFVCAALTLPGCAELQKKTGVEDKTAGAVGGAAIGCAAGILLARVTGGNSRDGCLAGAVVGGLVGFEKARQEEIAAADQVRKDAIASLSNLPPAQSKSVIVSPVRTVEVSATDKATNQTKRYSAFDSVSIQVPVSAKTTPQYEATLAKLKTLAERVADERGSAEIILAVNDTDAKMQKMALESNTVKTLKGNPITVTRRIDPTLKLGLQSMTVKAGNLRTEV
jgi:hypothetical protein